MLLIDAGLDWLANGLLAASWWQIVLYALVTTHIPLREVTERLQISEIVRVGLLLADFLSGKHQPRGELNSFPRPKQSRPKFPSNTARRSFRLVYLNPKPVSPLNYQAART